MAIVVGGVTVDLSANSIIIVKEMEKAAQATLKASQRMQGDLNKWGTTFGRNEMRIKRSITSVLASVRNLGIGFGALGAAFGIREIVRQADVWTQLRSQLRLVTDSSDDLAASLGDVRDIARETRVSVTSAGSLYARFARSVDSLRGDQERLAAIVRTTNQAVAISGTTAAAASAALFQFGQGLAADALRGEELNSIMEQTPRLAKAMADGLGVPIGQLRELAKQGKLTAETVINAIESQADVINKEFQGVEITVDAAMTVLADSFGAFIDELNTSTGATKGLVGLLESAARGIENLGAVFKAVGADIENSVVLRFLGFTEAPGAGAARQKLIDDTNKLFAAQQRLADIAAGVLVEGSIPGVRPTMGGAAGAPPSGPFGILPAPAIPQGLIESSKRALEKRLEAAKADEKAALALIKAAEKLGERTIMSAREAKPIPFEREGGRLAGPGIGLPGPGTFSAQLADMDALIEAGRPIDEVTTSMEELANTTIATAGAVAGLSAAMATMGEGNGLANAGALISSLAAITSAAIATATAVSSAKFAAGDFTAVASTIAAGAAVAGALLSLIGGISGRAHGGPVSAGQPYRVGERGEELFVPSQSGSIVSNAELRSGGGGSTSTVRLEFIGQGLDVVRAIRDPRARRMIAEAVAREMGANPALRSLAVRRG